MKSIPFLLTVISGAVLVASCKPDPVDPVAPAETWPPTSNAVCISFEHKAGSDSLIVDTELRYQNINGDSFTCEAMKYYISNVSFTDNLGNTWYEPESYHLIDAADLNSCRIYIDDMPSGNYVSMNFMIGVDSARNVSGAQTGALDPAHGMFWTWSSGYIMAKYEGRSPMSTQPFGLVLLHLGGFSGTYASQRWASPSFNVQQLQITSSTVPTIHMKSDLLEWFQNPNVIDFSSVNNVNTPTNMSVSIANNIPDSFTITSIEN